MAKKHSEKRPHVTVFCGCDPKGKKGKMYRDLAFRFGESLAQENLVCVNGGSGGLMDSVSEGAVKAGGQVHSIVLSVENWARTSRHFTKQETHTKIGKRQSRLLELGDAFVALPGGIGTTFEIFEVLCKKGLKEIDPKTPLICVGPYFAPLQKWLKTIKSEGFAWLDIPVYITFVRDDTAALNILTKYYSKGKK